MKKGKLTIPLKSVPEGVKLCLDNAAQFCSDARVLAEKMSYQHALGFCIYAIEELGKAELLKEMAVYSKQKGEDSVTLEYTKPQDFYRMPLKDLRKRGFSKNSPINPFYDHRSKLLYAQSVMHFAADDRLLKSLEGKNIRSFRELIKSYEELDTPAYVSKTETTRIRELAMYVGYDANIDKWNNGKLEISLREILEISTDIEKAITYLRN